MKFNKEQTFTKIVQPSIQNIKWKFQITCILPEFKLWSTRYMINVGVQQWHGKHVKTSMLQRFYKIINQIFFYPSQQTSISAMSLYTSIIICQKIKMKERGGGKGGEVTWFCHFKIKWYAWELRFGSTLNIQASGHT